MSHNIDLPRHRYCHVIESVVHREGRDDKTVPCVWWGVSATPGRMFGCHILLESGAMVADLPLHALRHRENAPPLAEWLPGQSQRWDAYGWHLEAHEPAYLSGLTCRVLSADHRNILGTGGLWFYLDHVRDGYSLEPGQHKHHWVVALDEGVFTCVPQDMVLVTESSFTDEGGIPPMKRQTTIYHAEA